MKKPFVVLQYAYELSGKLKKAEDNKIDIVAELKEKILAGEDGESEDRKAAKIKLLDKIAKFGNFDTIKVVEKKKETEAAEAETKEEEEAKVEEEKEDEKASCAMILLLLVLGLAAAALLLFE